MPVRVFHISGTVTDSTTKKGVPDLRVEVWDRDDQQHTLLGAAVTAARGRFSIAVSAEVPPVVTGGVPAFLKVFQQTAPLSASGDTAIQDLFTQTAPLNLSVDARLTERAPTDKIALSQVLDAIDFIRLTDFKGLFQEGKDRVSATTSVVGDSLKSAASKVKIGPIRLPKVRTSDVIRQDTATATQRLSAQGVTVTAVKDYKGDLSSLNLVTSVPVNVKSGDKIELYQQNGVVRGYRIVKDTPPPINAVTVGRIQNDITSLQSKLDAKSAEVDQLQVELTRKSEQVDQLNSQMTALRQAHDQLAARSADIAALQETMKAVKTRLQIP
jgi:hypothetical protein